LTDPALIELAGIHGLQTEFWDWKGNLTSIEASTIIAILAAMGVDASSPEAITAALADARDAPWRRPLPPCTVTIESRPQKVDVHVPSGAPASLVIQLEDGGQREAAQVDNWHPDRDIDGRPTGEASFELPDDLPQGYHRLILYSGEKLAEASLIVTPPYLGLPAVVGQRQIWGYATQLYSVRSRGSWGVGDFRDLTALATWAAAQEQADYVLVNPLHAAEPEPPLQPSPYLPVTRQFINPLYIRPEDIPEYAEVVGTARAKLRSLKRGVTKKAANSALLLRDDAWVAKRAALRIIFSVGLSPSRRLAFDAYRRSEGRELHDFAVWTVLCAKHGRDWHDWPEELRRPSSPEVGAFADAHTDDVEFAEWCQWMAQDQLSHAHEVALDTGMRIGVITDLAVGVSPAGADTWMMTGMYADGIEVGAPPDEYNQLGQTWAQPPWRPDRLADLAYVPFRQIVREALRHAGGVRIDHVLGLFRLWWVPRGNTADHGCYVRYDHEAMVGIVALEAQRAGTFVVGEDLGTVEPWVRHYLASRGILGTTVLWFECDDFGHVRPPDQWRAACMASVTTHDLPPTTGYLALDHVRLRHELGLLTRSLAEELAAATHEQKWWLDYVINHGYVQEEIGGVAVDHDEALVLALYRALANSSAQVRCAALVDAIGDRRTQNQPGTVDEYPNWRVPLCDSTGSPVTLEDVFASPRPMRLAAVMNGWTHVPPPLTGMEEARHA